MTVLEEVRAELDSARRKFSSFHSMHEGYGTLLEEVDELWLCVKMRQSNPQRREFARKECIQVAAMAIRFLEDCCEGPPCSDEGEALTQENV
jgi:hypothetical protein